MTANRFLPTFSRWSRPGSPGRMRSPSVTFSPSSSTPPCAISRRASVLLGASPALVIAATSGVGPAGRTLRSAVTVGNSRARKRCRNAVPARSAAAAPWQLNLLVGTAQLDVRLQRHRVIPLDQRVQELVDADRLLIVITLVEIVALEHPGHAVVRAKMDELLGRESVHPAAVEVDEGPLGVQDFEDLPLVRLGVLPHLFLRQRLAGLRDTGRVPNHAGEIADEEDHLMAHMLKVFELVEEEGVPEMEIRRGGIESGLDAERPPLFERRRDLVLELLRGDDLDGPARDEGELPLHFVHGASAVLTNGRKRFIRFSPMPRTFLRSSTLRNPLWLLRYSTRRWASFSPMPGSSMKSSARAELRSSGNVTGRRRTAPGVTDTGRAEPACDRRATACADSVSFPRSDAQ